MTEKVLTCENNLVGIWTPDFERVFQFAESVKKSCADRLKTCMYIHVDQFLMDLVDHIRTEDGKSQTLLEQYGRYDVLIINDVEEFRGKMETQWLLCQLVELRRKLNKKTVLIGYRDYKTLFLNGALKTLLDSAENIYEL